MATHVYPLTNQHGLTSLGQALNAGHTAHLAFGQQLRTIL